jgi:hypothetical protein
MKKLYATPTVEFTGFDVEDVITVSIRTVVESPDEVQAVLDAVEQTGIMGSYDKTVHYGSYTW